MDKLTPEAKSLTEHEHLSEDMRAAVLHVELPPKHAPKDSVLRKPEDRLEEAVNLTNSLGLDIIWQDTVKLSKINPKTLIGSGKVEELLAPIADQKLEVLVVNAQLSPTQQRNLELILKTKVIDRTGLILEIFGARAQTHAGRLQVELASLTYQASRLVRLWTHLERQRGGMSKTGGPGERQIELDKRMIRERVEKIKVDLKEVEKTRNLHRKARIKAGLPVVALVGYTNAGKSTLFNALVGDEQAESKDMLFATLDPLMRKIELPSGREVILSDTVGFVSDLPHQLVEAFHATLEEVAMADVLIHVQDGSSAQVEAQAKDVRKVLKNIGADDKPMIDVWNKSDLPKEYEGTVHLQPDIEVSAVTGEGISKLFAAIESHFAAEEHLCHYELNAAQGRLLAWLHAHGDVVNSELDKETYNIDVRLSTEDKGAFEQMLQK